MPRPQSVTDAQIKQAAREVFLEHGPAAPVSLIARRLGVSHAAVFSRAGSKEKLMLDALSPERPRASEWLEQPPPDEGAEARLIEILLDLFEFLARVVPGLVVIRAAGLSMDDLPSSGGPPPPVALRHGLSGWLAAAARAGTLIVDDPAWLAEGLLGAMEARCFNAYLGGDTFAPGDDATFIQELVHGLLPAAPLTRTHV